MIRAIDLQTVFSKAPAVEQLYQTMLHHPDVSQRQFALHMLQKFYNLQQRPRQSTQAEGPGIHRDREKRKDRRSAESRDGERRRENQADAGDARPGSREGEPGGHVNIVI